jgi:hypothetical protein
MKGREHPKVAIDTEVLPKKKADKPGERTSLQLETLAADPGLPRGYLSKSAIEMYLRCPKQFEFHYILGLSSPPGVAMVEGSSHGEALNMTNLHFIQKKEHLPERVVIEKFCDEFNDRQKEIPAQEWVKADETKDSVIERGKLLLPAYFRGHGRTIVPIAVEKRIEVDMGGVPVLGFIDVEQPDSVDDYKVVGRTYSQNDADTDLQLTIYSKAAKKRKVGFVCLVKTKVPKVEHIPAERTDGDYRAAEALVASVSDAIKKGAFPMCNPKNTFPCSKKFCGFWSRCRGKQLGR